MPTPLTDADKVLRNDTGKDIVSALETIADNTSWAGHTAGDLPLGNTTPVGSTAAAIGSLSTLTTTDKSSIVGAVNEVNAGKLTRKKYSVTLVSNPYVPPFTHFYGLDITTDATTYGTPVGVWCDNAGVIPHIQNANRIDLSANNALTCDVFVFYCSNINVIS